jgi:hypothetical protein
METREFHHEHEDVMLREFLHEKQDEHLLLDGSAPDVKQSALWDALARSSVLYAWDRLIQRPSYGRIHMLESRFEESGLEGGVEVHHGKEGTRIVMYFEGVHRTIVYSYEELMRNTILREGY